MSAQGLHRLMGGTFQKVKPGLCEQCALRRNYGEWEGYCTARGKILSYRAPTKRKPTCDDFKGKEDEYATAALDV